MRLNFLICKMGIKLPTSNGHCVSNEQMNVKSSHTQTMAAGRKKKKVSKKGKKVRHLLLLELPRLMESGPECRLSNKPSQHLRET